jgi:2-C-methyl-D-erythritol 4-phosphate cytidylyltransferase
MTDSPLRYWAVIPAAGTGKRMRADRPKQYLRLAGKTVIEHTLERFLCHPALSGIVVALDKDDRYWSALEIANDTSLKTVVGGAQRCHSVLNALDYLSHNAAPYDWVLVHDAARPCLAAEDLDLMMETLTQDAVGGILAVPVKDTIKRGTMDLRIAATVDRKALWHALTPQMFRLGLLTEALSTSLENHYLVTDEASAVEHIGLKPKLVQGRAYNIKITHPEDLPLAEYYLERERRSAGFWL